MEEQDTINITVIIANRPYPLKIKAVDEAAIRRIVKEVNEKVNRFQLAYTNKDKQDCLSMAALSYAVDLYKSKENTSNNIELSQQLSIIESILDKVIEQ